LRKQQDSALSFSATGSKGQCGDCNLKATSTFLGHASTAITGDIYTHVTTDAERADMLKLEEVMFPAGAISLLPPPTVN